MTDLPPLSAGETLSPGDQNDHVLALQQRLAEYGYFTDTQDGVFGDSTEAAVREYQRACNLIEDGVVGTEVWELLGQSPAEPEYAEPEYAEPEPEPEPEAAAGYPQVGDLSEDGHWMWDGATWVPAQPSGQDDSVGAPAAAEPGMVSEDGQWRWDGQQWQPNTPEGEEQELTPELFQEVIAQSMQVNTSATA
ncbi:peptidoglycan-binding protein [Actinokineospora soli]|uniref:Peptidoglycan-binding protein n=1 Tax=Actinokineospora soli TaxID=1048753 RepID=A0ABW2TN11_9PSEU